MPVKDIRAEELRDKIRNNLESLEIIDVREPEEYEVVHIKGSKLMPLNDIQAREEEIDWNKEVIFICRSGARSKLAATLTARGEKEAENLQFGIYECQSDGKSEFLEGTMEGLGEYL